MTRVLAIALPIIIIVVLGFGGTKVLESLKEAPEVTEEPPKALAVFVEPVELVDYTYQVDVQGEVRPRRETLIAPQINGRISWIADKFADGGFIREGELIARLETADYELAVVRAESTVAGAAQRLAREKAEAELAIQDLADLGIEESSPLARREPQLAEAQASLDAANSQLRDAELALARTEIRAPFDGRVLERNVDLGQFVSPGSGIGRMFATDAVEVAFPITDSDLGRIGLPLAFNASTDNPGPEVIFQASVGGKERRWVGRITRTAAAFNSQTRLISIFGELQDPYGAGADDGAPMAPGLFVTATIAGDTVERAYRIPRDGLRGLDQVYVADAETDTMAIRTVEVIESNTEGAYLVAGVAEGEEVVVSPVQAPFDGMRIQILRRNADGSVQQDELAPTRVDTDAALVAGTPGSDETESE